MAPTRAAIDGGSAAALRWSTCGSTRTLGGPQPTMLFKKTQEDCIGTNQSASHMSQWHVLWLSPLCLLILFVVESHTLPYGLRVVRLGLERWSWAALLSPSAAFCEFVIFISVTAPVGGLISALTLLTVAQPGGRHTVSRSSADRRPRLVAASYHRRPHLGIFPLHVRS